MQLTFEGRGARWTGAAEIADRTEKDRHQPWTVRVSSGSKTVAGTMLVTELAAERAGSGEEADRALGRAFERALVAELGLRALASGFRFIVDHRWVRDG